MSLLRLKSVSASYGKVRVIEDITLSVEMGEIVALIGANGAGKTTLMKTISGLMDGHEGSIKFQGKEINRLPGHRRVELGILHVPEGRSIFYPLTVEENLIMGGYLLKNRREVKEKEDIVFSMFPRLKERRRQMAGTLSGGEQQMLAIGRALMARPVIMMLDEPSLGLSPILVREIFEIIVSLNKQGCTVLLVEQNAQLALGVANRGYVLETGKIVMSDSAKNLLNDEGIRKAYLGA